MKPNFRRRVLAVFAVISLFVILPFSARASVYEDALYFSGQVADVFDVVIDSIVYYFSEDSSISLIKPSVRPPVKIVSPDPVKNSIVESVAVKAAALAPREIHPISASDSILAARIAALERNISELRSAPLSFSPPPQRIIERVVEKQTVLRDTDAVSTATLDLRLNQIDNKLSAAIRGVSASSNRQTSALSQTVALSSRINELNGVTLRNVTVSGVSGLAASEIPTLSASYLLLSGGTLTGSTTLSAGNFGIGTSSPYAALSVEGASALGNSATAGYFVATTSATSTFTGGITANALNITSSSATSTFANGIQLSAGCFLLADGSCAGNAGGNWSLSNTNTVLTSGSVGIGTSTPYAKLSVVGEAVAAYFTATTTATSTFPNLLATGATTTNLAVTGTASTSRLVVSSTLDFPAVGSGVVTGRITVGGERFMYMTGTGATRNLFVGHNSGSLSVSGSRNTGFGTNALSSIIGGSGGHNTAIGDNALAANTDGNYNTALGLNALVTTSSGSSNVAVGYQAGTGNTTGSNNTFIGYNSDIVGSTQLSNATAIGYNALVGTSNSIVLGGTGADAVNVGISTTTPAWKLQVAAAGAPQLTLSDTAAGANLKHWAFTSQAGNLYISTSTDAYATSTTPALSILTGGAYNTGRVAIGTSTSYSKLTVWGGTYAAAGKVLEVANSASTTLLYQSNDGNFSAGYNNSITAGGKNAVVGDSNTLSSVSGDAFALGFSNTVSNTVGVAIGGSNTVSGANSQAIGNLNTAAGGSAMAIGNLVSASGDWSIALGVGDTNTSAALANSTASSLMVGFQSTIPTFFVGPASGAGTTGKSAFATSSPYAKLTVWGSGTGTGQLFELANSASTTVARVLDNGTTYLLGNVGIGTTTPYALLSVSNAVGTAANTPLFTIASTTAGTATTTHLTVLASGNVGIGTTSPTQKLVVQGGVCITTGNVCPSESSGGLRVDTGGSVGGDDPGDVFDVAEIYPATEDVFPGDIVAVDPNATVKASVKKARAGEALLGIVSTKPALAINGSSIALGREHEQTSLRPLIALVGRVPVKVNLEAGAISIGDRITLSSTPGVGMKMKSSAQASVGVALQAFTGETGDGSFSQMAQILVFVNLSGGRLQGVAGGTVESGWFVDAESGVMRMAASGALDMQGKDIVGVGRLLAANGAWSFDADGKLTVKSLTVGSVTQPTGITLFDRSTAAPYCFFIENGVAQSVQGTCEASGASSSGSIQTSTPTTASSTVSSDTEAPVITLLGNNPAQLQKGDSYIDPGATVSDNVDSNLGVQISGDTIVTSDDATFTLRYNVIDSAGNKATEVTRTVIVGSGSTTVVQVIGNDSPTLIE